MNFRLTSCAIAAILGAATGLPSVASAQGALTQSWKTDGGWLTELRVHPNGAKVCSTGKAGSKPHAFGLSFVRSGPEAVVLVVDQAQPPSGGATEMIFRQGGQTVGAVKAMTEGPAFASTDPTGPQATGIMSKLTDQPLVIEVGGRRYETALTGLSDALAQLARCASGAG
ncbi:hypothetical protein [Pseudorhodoplanes sp.]|uniref:hypothetical protein n=1 Tax=Pseudorhodoplanes sp. TaxID=1934341 RepID=UPI002C705993|nr:hypothetical protein [Pseudorhodoplanes sp.]HWV54654.1 hypothetical protein [Pseudorhodoplanes sp.]